MAINLGGGQLIQTSDPSGAQQFQSGQQAQQMQSQQLLAQLSSALGQLNLERDVQSWNQFRDLYDQEQTRLASMGQPAYTMDANSIINLMQTAGVNPSEEQVAGFLEAQEGRKLSTQERIRLEKEKAGAEILDDPNLDLLSKDVQVQVGTYLKGKDLSEFTKDFDSFVLDAGTEGDTTGFPREVRQQLWDVLNESAGGSLGNLDNERLLQAVRDGKLTVDRSQQGIINQASAEKVRGNLNDHSQSAAQAGDQRFLGFLNRPKTAQAFANDTRDVKEVVTPSGKAAYEGFSNSTPLASWDRAIANNKLVKDAQDFLKFTEMQQSGEELNASQKEIVTALATDFQDWSMQDVANLAIKNEGYVPLMREVDKVQAVPGVDGQLEIQLPQNFFSEIGALQEEVPEYETQRTKSKITELENLNRQVEEAGFGGEAPGVQTLREAQIMSTKAQAQAYLSQAAGGTITLDDPTLERYASRLDEYMFLYNKILSENDFNSAKANMLWAKTPYGEPGGLWEQLVSEAGIDGISLGSAPVVYKDGFLNLFKRETSLPTGSIGRLGSGQRSTLTGAAGNF